jgi:hypothetical protein
MLSMLLLTLSMPADAQEISTTIGQIISLDMHATGAPDSCGALNPGATWGYQFEAPVNDERPNASAAFARLELGVRALPCRGFGASTGAKLGMRTGPIQFGVKIYAGPTFNPAWDTPVFANVGLGPSVDVAFKRVEVGVDLALMQGYLNQGFIDINTHVGFRF